MEHNNYKEFRYFPRPYEGESLYSLVARYQAHTLEISSNINSQLLSRSRNSSISPLLPNAISGILRKVDLFKSEDDALACTPYFFYSKFLNTSQQKKFRAFILNNEKRPILPTRKWKTSLRFCPECVESDLKKTGESYWRTEHQIPYVRICLKHNLKLQEFQLPMDKTLRYHYYPAILLEGTVYKTEINQSLIHRQIAQKVNDILNDPCSFDKKALLKLAEHKGIFSYSKNKVHVKSKVKDLFSTFIKNTEFDESIGAIDLKHSLFKPTRSSNESIISILLEIFLRDFELPPPCEDKMISTSCINPLCKSFKTVLPIELKVDLLKLKNRKVKCPTCKMEFIASIKANYKPRITDYGILVHSTVKRLSRTHTNGEIAEILNLSKKKVCEIKYRERSNNIRSTKIDKEQRRGLWKRELDSPDFVSIQASSLKLKTVFGYLRKKDPKWLVKTNEPFRKKKGALLKKGVNRVKDNYYVEQLQKLVNEFNLSKSKSRLSKDLMLRSINLRLKRLSEKWPKTFQFIKSNEEDAFAYKKRVIQSFVEKNSKLGIPLSRGFLNDRFKLKRLSKRQRDQIYSLVD